MDNEQNTRRTAYEKEILAIADEMAASVTALTPQTYDTFISSREKLQSKVHDALYACSK